MRTTTSAGTGPDGAVEAEGYAGVVGPGSTEVEPPRTPPTGPAAARSRAP